MCFHINIKCETIKSRGALSKQQKHTSRSIVKKSKILIILCFNPFHVGKEISPHDLRHFFCSHALESGLSVHEVAKQAGHSNIHTTLLYINPTKEELINR